MNPDLAGSDLTEIGSSFGQLRTCGISPDSSPTRGQGRHNLCYPGVLSTDSRPSQDVSGRGAVYRPNHKIVLLGGNFPSITAENSKSLQDALVSQHSGLLEAPASKDRENTTSPRRTSTLKSAAATRSYQTRQPPPQVELPDLFYAHDPVKYKTYENDCSLAYADFYGFIRNSLKKHKSRKNMEREKITDRQYKAALQRYKAPGKLKSLEEKHRAQWKSIRHELFGTPLDHPIPECDTHKPSKAKRTPREKEDGNNKIVEDEMQGLDQDLFLHGEPQPQDVDEDIINSDVFNRGSNGHLAQTTIFHQEGCDVYQANQRVPPVNNIPTIAESPPDGALILSQSNVRTLNVVPAPRIRYCLRKLGEIERAMLGSEQMNHFVHLSEELQGDFKRLSDYIDAIHSKILSSQPLILAMHSTQLDPNQEQILSWNQSPGSEFDFIDDPQATFDGTQFSQTNSLLTPGESSAHYSYECSQGWSSHEGGDFS